MVTQVGEVRTQQRRTLNIQRLFAAPWFQLPRLNHEKCDAYNYVIYDVTFDMSCDMCYIVSRDSSFIHNKISATAFFIYASIEIRTISSNKLHYDQNLIKIRMRKILNSTINYVIFFKKLWWWFSIWSFEMLSCSNKMILCAVQKSPLQVWIANQGTSFKLS